jgi:hypothetical protein
MSELEFEADDVIEDPDVRAVSVVWGEEADDPDVTVVGCSKHEAVGLLMFGLVDLLLGPRDDDEDE